MRGYAAIGTYLGHPPALRRRGEQQVMDDAKGRDGGGRGSRASASYAMCSLPSGVGCEFDASRGEGKGGGESCGGGGCVGWWWGWMACSVLSYSARVLVRGEARRGRDTGEAPAHTLRVRLTRGPGAAWRCEKKGSLNSSGREPTMVFAVRPGWSPFFRLEKDLDQSLFALD